MLDLGVFDSFLDQAPKDGVIEIVDVAINLSPLEIILKGVDIWIENNSTIKGWSLFELAFEVILPVHHIGGCEGRNNTALYLINPTVEQLSLLHECK